MKPYPRTIEETLPSVTAALRQITRLRAEDTANFNNLQNVFLSGRKVGKVPASSADVEATDRVGDVSFAVDGSYIYFCVDASGTVVWRRIALGSW